MRPPIDGGVALVTGASSGIGLAIARELAPRSAKLVLVARRRDRLEALAEELRAAHRGLEVHVEECDLAEVPAIEAMLARVHAAVGDVDVLINNAGIGDAAEFLGSDWEKLHHMIRLNVVGLTLLTRRLVVGMVARRRGGVLNVSSGFGLEVLPSYGVYAGTKHYVTALSEALRCELRRHGVVVTQVCPGPTRTEFDSVAGVPEGIAPGLATLSAEACARASVRAFDRGRAMVIPGLLYGSVIRLSGMVPRWIKRPFLRLIGWYMRRYEARLAASTP